jgi:hypothetical protein
MTTYAIENVNRPGRYWNALGWVSEFDGSQKIYTSEAMTRRAVSKLSRAGYDVQVVRNPAEVRAEVENRS